MALGPVTVGATATALIKKAIDEIYEPLKGTAIKTLGLARSDVKEAAIARALSAVTKVKTLWNIERSVSLYDFYYPSKIEFSETVKKQVSSIKDFGFNQSFVIQGTAGQGKSIFFRYLCGQEIKANSTSSRVPIFVELRRIRSDFSLLTLIIEALEKFKLPATESAWKYFAKSGKFVLLLDAFDEVEPALADRTVSEIETLIDLSGGGLQVIVTSRPNADIQKSSKFTVCKLSPLDRSDHLPFLKRICSEKGQAESLDKVIQGSSADVSGLLTTPLMMTLLVILYKSLQTVPDTVPKFYEELFDVLFYRHDHSKPGFRRKRFTSLDDSTLKKLFSAFCFYVRMQNLGVLTNEKFAKCCEQACTACNLVVDPEKFKSELTRTVCLMQEEGFEISFIHKSVAQYYAASFVSKSGEAFANTFYEITKQAPGWELELRFLSDIDSFRFMKSHELPTLMEISEKAGINFGVFDKTQCAKINEYLSKRIKILMLRPKSQQAHSTDVSLKALRGWTSGEFKNPAIGHLCSNWMFGLYQNLVKDGVVVPSAQYEPDQQELFVPLTEFKSVIEEYSEKIAMPILTELETRYQRARTVIRTEEEKTARLAKFLPGANAISPMSKAS